MGLTVYIFGVAIILIVVLLLISVLSPDNWGRISAGCNDSCCPSCAGGSCSGGAGSGSGSGGSSENGSKSLLAGPTQVDKGQNQLENLQEKIDPYSAAFPLPLWQQYAQEKEKAQKETFVTRSTFIVTPKKKTPPPFTYRAPKPMISHKKSTTLKRGPKGPFLSANKKKQ